MRSIILQEGRQTRNSWILSVHIGIIWGLYEGQNATKTNDKAVMTSDTGSPFCST